MRVFVGMVDLIKDFGAMSIFYFVLHVLGLSGYIPSLLFSELDCVIEQGCNLNAKFADHALDHV